MDGNSRKKVKTTAQAASQALTKKNTCKKNMTAARRRWAAATTARKLPSCPHLCSEICHPDQCPSIDNCIKKVTVRCACQNLKAEWQCRDVQKAYHAGGRDSVNIQKNRYGLGILPCNSECVSKLKAKDSELLHRKTSVNENKVLVETESLPKRRKRREQIKEVGQISRFQAMKAITHRCLLFTLILLILIGSMYYGYKGIYWLSDRMNEIEIKQLKKGYRRF